MGSPLLTRWLLFAALKETYADHPTALDDAMAMVLDDLRAAQRTGVALQVHGQEIQLRFAVTAVKGDWPFLIESGHLERHFRRAPKRGAAGNPLGHIGVCHLCLGGYSGVPYEDFSAVPQWESTMGSAAAMVPWHSVSPWHSLPSLPSFRAWTFRPDIFHNFHLGHGRYFISSVLVLLQAFEPGNGIEARFQAMTQKWLQFCHARHVTQMRLGP